jgi:hypothetical protein
LVVLGTTTGSVLLYDQQSHTFVGSPIKVCGGVEIGFLFANENHIMMGTSNSVIQKWEIIPGTKLFESGASQRITFDGPIRSFSFDLNFTEVWQFLNIIGTCRNTNWNSLVHKC